MMGFTGVLLCVVASSAVIDCFRVYPMKNGDMESQTDVDLSEEVEEETSPGTIPDSTIPLSYDPDSPCEPHVKCGFQQVEYKPTLFIGEFKKYCTCAEGEVCEKDGQDLGNYYYYYRCKNVTETDATETSDQSAARSTRESSISSIATPLPMFSVIEATVPQDFDEDDECEPKVRCGFQPFDIDPSHPVGDFEKYCICPEGEECEAAGQSLSGRYIYYECKKLTEDGTTHAQSDLATASPITKGIIHDDL